MLTVAKLNKALMLLRDETIDGDVTSLKHKWIVWPKKGDGCMPKVSELTGIPWHVEKWTRNEGDERRHKSRCIYYRKKDSYCKYLYIECIK